MNKTNTISHAAEVKIENLTKSFGSQLVLDNVSFDIKPSEIFVIMGPSGSGKSVLLKNIIGLEKPDSGKVLINDLDAAIPQTHAEVVTSIVFQTGALFNSMTVYDNLAFYSKEHNLYSKPELRSEVEKTLEILSLSNAANKYPSELSGGMRKRVAIARSLMVRPQLILFDEPTSELDPIMGATISEIIATLNEKSQVTSIVVSHDPYLASSIASRVALLFDGKVHLIAKPGELDHSDDPKVIEFLKPKINIKNPRFRQHF